MYNIDCQRYKLNGTESTLGENKVVETVDNKEIYATFYIKCDNEDDNNSFNLDYYGDCEFTVEKNRCEDNLYIKENKTPYDRNFTITCIHANDSNVYVQIELIQKADVYKLELTSGAENVGEGKYSKQLQSIINEKFGGTNADLNYNYYEQHIFNINVSGGSKKYRIESILRCHEDTENQNQINYHSFDNGFVYNKFDNKLVITNYGRPFLDEKDYYIIRLSHEDYRELTIELKLTYSQQRNGNRHVSYAHRSPQNLQPISRQVSEIYMPYSEFMQRLEAEQNIQTQNDVNEYEIKFREEIGEEIVVVGQRNDIILHFEVFENGEISDLMVRVSSIGRWCSVTTDETNRIMRIKINNKPLGQRKARVNISIVDFPGTYLTFLVTNVPE